MNISDLTGQRAVRIKYSISLWPEGGLTVENVGELSTLYSAAHRSRAKNLEAALSALALLLDMPREDVTEEWVLKQGGIVESFSSQGAGVTSAPTSTLPA